MINHLILFLHVLSDNPTKTDFAENADILEKYFIMYKINHTFVRDMCLYPRPRPFIRTMNIHLHVK